MQNDLWFKRKRYGWGWTPVTWQGWAVIGVYFVAILAFAATIDRTSLPLEIVVTFVVPTIVLTATLIRICYRKGEAPRWQWGNETKNK